MPDFVVKIGWWEEHTSWVSVAADDEATAKAFAIAHLNELVQEVPLDEHTATGTVEDIQFMGMCIGRKEVAEDAEI